MTEEKQAEENYEKYSKDKAPPITFNLKTDRYVEILREGEVIGHIFSDTPNGHSSYSGKRSIQICGFDHITGEWGCGCFKGKRDLCVDFDMKPEDCGMHTMVEIGKAKKPYSDDKEYTVEKCWHCGKLELK